MPRPRKRFGQHWLKDSSVHRAMVGASGLSLEAMAGRAALPEDSPCVVEIGPGTGKLSRRLLAAGARVLAYELDRDLCTVLRKNFGSEDRFTLVEGDFLRQPLPKEGQMVVANIPYNITSPILEKVLGSPESPVRQFSTIVLLVQKEIGDRLCAEVGTKAYGAMSVRTQFLAKCEVLRTVPRTAFQPPPKVESAIIRLTPHQHEAVPKDARWLSVLIRQGFATRRKTLGNALQSLVDKQAVYAALEAIGRDPLSRAEALTVSDWVAFSNALLPARSDASSPPVASKEAPSSVG
ncbi:MAG: 16S rRNA (adenine(1518)-N(6)/adenine(1519)-N(6))-dimethyltransferase RsmA [Synechococcus sp.]